MTILYNKVIWKVAKHIDCDWGRSEYTTIDCDQGTAASNLYNVIGVVRRLQTVSNQFLKLNLTDSECLPINYEQKHTSHTFLVYLLIKARIFYNSISLLI